jgi:hypothetical protein
MAAAVCARGTDIEIAPGISVANTAIGRRYHRFAQEGFAGQPFSGKMVIEPGQPATRWALATQDAEVPADWKAWDAWRLGSKLGKAYREGQMTLNGTGWLVPAR